MSLADEVIIFLSCETTSWLNLWPFFQQTKRICIIGLFLRGQGLSVSFPIILILNIQIPEWNITSWFFIQRRRRLYEGRYPIRVFYSKYKITKCILTRCKEEKPNNSELGHVFLHEQIRVIRNESTLNHNAGVLLRPYLVSVQIAVKNRKTSSFGLKIRRFLAFSKDILKHPLCSENLATFSNYVIILSYSRPMNDCVLMLRTVQNVAKF